MWSIEELKIFKREETLQEEILNSVTHAIGLGLSIAVLFISIFSTIQRNLGQRVLYSLVIYGFSLVLLYAASTLYHAIRYKPLKRIFRTIDHVSIYFLIAGSYTPYCLLTLQNENGAFYLSILWALAIIGSIVKVFTTGKFMILSTIFYVFLGWFGIFFFDKIIANLPFAGIVYITLGGLSYTIGIVFFVQKIKYAHAIWHIFVLAGSILHFISVWEYVLPR